MAPIWSLSRKRKINPTAMGVMNIGASSIERVRSRAQRCFCNASAMARPISSSSPTATHTNVAVVPNACQNAPSCSVAT